MLKRPTSEEASWSESPLSDESPTGSEWLRTESLPDGVAEVRRSVAECETHSQPDPPGTGVGHGGSRRLRRAGSCSSSSVGGDDGGRRAQRI